MNKDLQDDHMGAFMEAFIPEKREEDSSGSPETSEEQEGASPTPEDETHSDDTSSVESEESDTGSVEEEETDPSAAERIAALEAEIRALREQKATPPEGAPERTSDDAPPAAPPLATKEDYDKILEGDFETFQQVMLRVAKTAAETGAQAVLLSLPQTIGGMLRAHTDDQKLIDDFWKSNADLKPYKKYLRLEVEELGKSGRQLDKSQLLEEAAKALRTNFKIAKPEVKKRPAREPSGQPDGAGGKQGGSNKPKPRTLQERKASGEKLSAAEEQDLHMDAFMRKI